MRSLHIVSISVLAAALLAACGGTQADRRADERPSGDALPPVPTATWTLQAPPGPESVLRILIIGDTGYPGDEIERVRAAVKRANKDVVVVAGDLVYPGAPACTPGAIGREDKRLLDERLGAILGDLGAPTLLVLGNHDVLGARRDPAREACLLHYVTRHESLVMPSLTYVADLGVAVVAAINTNALDDAQGAMAREAFEGTSGWRLLLGHHTLKTYHDKETQDWVRPWLAGNRVTPDIYINGHAHVMQFGIYGGLPAITSGATAKTRERPACPGACGAGQEFGASTPGYAMLELEGDQATLTFHDVDGIELYRHVHTRRPDAP